MRTGVRPFKNKSPVLVGGRAQHNPVLNISNESMVNIKGSRSDYLIIGGLHGNASEAVTVGELISHVLGSIDFFAIQSSMSIDDHRTLRPNLIGLGKSPEFIHL